jgi:hypothetical protein
LTRADLARDLDAVARSLALSAAVLESLATSLRSPQDGPDLDDDAPAVPVAGMPACTCPCCADERAEGRRP